MSNAFLYIFLFYSGFISCSFDPELEQIPFAECEQPEFDIHQVGLLDTKIQGYWLSAPIIKICPGAGISKSRVKTALRYWEDLGYEFGEIIEPGYTGIGCEALAGEIAFRLPTQSELSQAVSNSRLGVAATQIHRPTQQILASDIYFQTTVASHQLKIVEHEIGHALGWEHHNFSNHIMHPSLHHSGYGSVGVEKYRYDILAREIRE